MVSRRQSRESTPSVRFLNGRLGSFVRLEAVGDLIASQNEYALQSSVSQLKGNIKDKIGEMREKILYHTAFIETALDDPEHISVDGVRGNTKKSRLMRS